MLIAANARAGISSGSAASEVAELCAGDARKLCRLNAKELLKAARGGDLAKVRAMRDKAFELTTSVAAYCDKILAM